VTVELVSSVYSENRKHIEDLSSLLFASLWQTDAIARQLNLCYILFKSKFKALRTLLNSSEYTNIRNIFFVSMPKNLAWTQQQVDSM
jgi:hypothetical protein